MLFLNNSAAPSFGFNPWGYGPPEPQDGEDPQEQAAGHKQNSVAASGVIGRGITNRPCAFATDNAAREFVG
jgi:hypothetical protein